jgi:hypothetical protein
MMVQLLMPTVGSWYRYSDGRLFEVVAVDEEDDTIETQYYDGTVEEIDGEAWEALGPRAVQAPEDYSGSMDMQKEDYGVDYEDSPLRKWSNPLDFFDADDH